MSADDASYSPLSTYDNTSLNIKENYSFESVFQTECHSNNAKLNNNLFSE